MICHPGKYATLIHNLLILDHLTWLSLLPTAPELQTPGRAGDFGPLSVDGPQKTSLGRSIEPFRLVTEL